MYVGVEVWQSVNIELCEERAGGGGGGDALFQ